MVSITETTIAAPKPIIPAVGAITHQLSPLAEPLTRLVAGLFLMPHGAQKLFGVFGGYGLEATGQFFAAKLGLPPALATVAGLVEFFGGLCLALGLLTRPAAALIVGLMAVAIIQVHLPNGYFWTDLGYEYPLFWGLTALSFVIRGGGRYSLDRMIGREF
jgi:putative oxidoreductase